MICALVEKTSSQRVYVKYFRKDILKAVNTDCFQGLGQRPGLVGNLHFAPYNPFALKKIF